MSDPSIRPDAVAIIGCIDLDATQHFYEQLDFRVTATFPEHGYRILHDPSGASVHLTIAPDGWVVPDRNASGVYLYTDRVRELATRLGCSADHKPWGLIEFAVSDPNGTLVRVGWPA